MMEKLKDIFYETSDLILAFVILLVMSTVITWQVSDSMAFSDYDIETNTNTSTSMDNPSTPENNMDSPTDPLVIIEDNDEAISDDEDYIVAKSEEKNDQPKDQPQNSSPPTKITIEIPSGTPGIGIAKILKENNLIDETSKFVSRVEELNLAVKLKSGTYKISSNASLDDIIYIITGQKR